MKRLYPLLLVATGLFVGFLCGALVTTARTDQAKFTYDQVIGQAGDTPITRGELAELAIYRHGSKILDQDLRKHAIVYEAARRAGVTATSDEVDQRIAEYQSLLQNYVELADLLGTKKAFDAIPRRILEDQFRTALLAEKLMKISVNNTDVQNTYIDNLKRFYRPPMAKLVLTVTNTEAAATRAYRRLKDGEDPRKVSTEISTDEAIAKMKGDLNWVSRSAMSYDVYTAIFDANDGKGLRPKDCTPVIKYKNENGKIDYMVFYVEDTRSSHQVELKEARTAVEFLARYQKLANQEPVWFAEQEKAIEWKRVSNLLEPVSPLVTVPATP